MDTRVHTVRARIWLYQGNASSPTEQTGAWHFITIPKAVAEEIRKDYIWPRRGFGAIPVSVSIGNTTWKTSVFPDKDGTHLLPLKKDVRTREQLHEGDTVGVSLTVL